MFSFYVHPFTVIKVQSVWRMQIAKKRRQEIEQAIKTLKKLVFSSSYILIHVIISVILDHIIVNYCDYCKMSVSLNMMIFSVKWMELF
jgi:hypothetical protein